MYFHFKKWRKQRKSANFMLTKHKASKRESRPEVEISPQILSYFVA